MEKIITKGSIWLADLSRVYKEDEDTQRQKGLRPVIISSNNTYNRYAPTVQVIPLSTKVCKPSPVHVKVGYTCGLREESIALVEQEMTIDKIDIQNKIGECTDEVLSQINKALIFQKNLTEPFDIYRARSLVRAIVEISNVDINKETSVGSIIVSELKWYCGEHGIDYKAFFMKHAPEFLQKERKVQRVAMAR